MPSQYPQENPEFVVMNEDEYEYEYVDEDGNVVAADGVDEDVEYEYEEEEVEYEEAEEEVIYEEEVGFSNAREVPAWAVSLGVHILLLLMLGMIVREMPTRPHLPPITSIAEELKPEDYKFDATVVDQMGSDSQVNMVSPSQQAATKMGQTPQEVMERQLDESFDVQETPPTVEVTEPHQSEFVDNVNLNGATEHVGGTEGAIDRITMEIAASLKEKKTLVIWMFDASQSLTKQRAQIADRFENVYKQLGVLGVDDEEKALKTAVVSFGKGYEFITEKPVDSASEVADAVRNIKNDASGLENVFSSLEVVINKWKIYRTSMNRNIMVVLVTDERGDDYARMEQTIGLCRRYGVKVYTVGPACIFGKEKSYVNWTYEDGFTEELPVDGGPETVAQERLNLGFWGVNGKNLERMSAGYGPYALTRLSAETGGMYLVNSDTTGPRFDPVIMRNYLPDYRPMAEYHKQLSQNMAKGMLVKAAYEANAENTPSPRLSFDADTDTILRQQITEAQKPAAVFDYKVAEMHTMLDLGEKDREKLDSPRWKASYDLAMGRVLAMRVRAYGYNQVLANMKANPLSFTKKGSNSWRLNASSEITAGPAVKKLAKKAIGYLTRVIDEHPGTPWAMLAERELSAPLGWEWEEFAGSRAMNQMNGNNNNQPQIQLADDPKQMMNKMKKAAPKRKRPNL